MVETNYGVYCLYTDDNKIYVGLSQNPRVRLYQHFRKTHNLRLKALLDDPNTKVHGKILRSNLTYKEAYELEKQYIKRYQDDSNYTVLNINCGGSKENINFLKPEKFPKRRCREKYTDSDIEQIRKICSKYRTIIASVDCKKFGLSRKYFLEILRGKQRSKAGGPLLGKDYSNG
jgi:predicted GIY-YIG superfamily endonuclease